MPDLVLPDADVPAADTTVLPDADAPKSKDVDPSAIDVPEWMKGLDEGLQGSEFLRNHDTVDKLAKTAVEQKKTLSKKIAAAYPTDQSTDEEWESMFKALGRPDTPGEYEIKIDMPTQKDQEGNDVAVPLNPQLDAMLRGIAHETGMNNAQYNKAIAKIVAMEKEAPNQHIEVLKSAKDDEGNKQPWNWGSEYGKNASVVNAAMGSLSAETRNALMNTFGPNPIISQAILELGKKSSPSTIHGKQPEEKGVAITLESIKSEIDAVMSDKAFDNPRLPGHLAINNKYAKLCEKQVNLELEKQGVKT